MAALQKFNLNITYLIKAFFSTCTLYTYLESAVIYFPNLIFIKEQLLKLINVLNLYTDLQ
jgi:hypothetical protein